MTAATDPRARRRILSGKRIIAAIAAIIGTAILWYYIARPETYRNAVASACEPVSFEGSRFTVCRYDPARHSLAIAASSADGKPLLTFRNLAASLGPRAARVVFAMNAGMYSLNARPIGLYVDDGMERHALNRGAGGGNFHMAPNGVFWTDGGGAHVATTDRFADLAPRDVAYATQSGPMLVIDGALHPRFTHDGPSRKIRNGVGVDADGHALFVISDDPVSFGKFARFYRDRLGCPNALFLDGFVSSLWDAASGRFDQRVPLGPMIVVSERAPAPR